MLAHSNLYCYLVDIVRSVAGCAQAERFRFGEGLDMNSFNAQAHSARPWKNRNVRICFSYCLIHLGLTLQFAARSFCFRVCVWGRIHVFGYEPSVASRATLIDTMIVVLGHRL